MRPVGSRYDVEPLCAWAMANGWTGAEVSNLRDYATRVLDGRSFRIPHAYGPARGASNKWIEEAAARSELPRN